MMNELPRRKQWVGLKNSFTRKIKI